MRKFLFIPVLLLLASSCSKNEDKQSNYSRDFPKDYVRKWVQIAYLNSDDYFTPQENGTYFQFDTDTSFVHHKGDIINETISGTYTREKTSSVIKLSDGNDKVRSSPVGYRFEIKIKEANDDKVIFIIVDGTLTPTIKIQRE